MAWFFFSYMVILEWKCDPPILLHHFTNNISLHPTIDEEKKRKAPSIAENYPNILKKPSVMALVYLVAFCVCPSGKQFIIAISPVNQGAHTLLQILPFSMPRMNHYTSAQYEIIPVRPTDLTEGAEIALKYTDLHAVGESVRNNKDGCKNKLQTIDLLYYSCFENNCISLLPFNFSILITFCQNRGTHFMHKKVKSTLMCCLTRHWDVSQTQAQSHSTPLNPFALDQPEKHSAKGRESPWQIYSPRQKSPAAMLRF